MESLIKDGDHERHNVFAECVCGHTIVNWQWHKWNPGDEIEEENDVIYQTNYHAHTGGMSFFEKIKLMYKIFIGRQHFLDDAQFTRKQVEYIRDGLTQALEDTKPRQGE
jgi:hypothetical protein